QASKPAEFRSLSSLPATRMWADGTSSSGGGAKGLKTLRRPDPADPSAIGSLDGTTAPLDWRISQAKSGRATAQARSSRQDQSRSGGQFVNASASRTVATDCLASASPSCL